MKLSQQSWTNLFKNTVTWTMGTIAVAMLYPLTRAQAVFAQTTTPVTHVREDKSGALILNESLNQRRTAPCTNSTGADPRTVNQQTSLAQTDVDAVSDGKGGVKIVFMSTKTTPYEPIAQGLTAQNQFQLQQEIPLTTSFNAQNPSIVPIAQNNNTQYFMYLYNTASPAANVWMDIYSPDFQRQPGFDGSTNPQKIGTAIGTQQLNIAGTASNLNGAPTLETVFQSQGPYGYVIGQRGFKPAAPGGPPVQPIDTTEFAVSTNNTVNNLNPDIDTNPVDNSTVTVWQQCPTSGIQICNLALRGVSRDAAGNPVYLDAKEKTYTMPGYDLRNGKIKFLNDGSGEFLMSFIGARPTDTYYTAFVQRFRANRTAKGAAISVPTLQIRDGNQAADLEILPNGFAVTASSSHVNNAYPLGYLQKFYNNNTLNGNLIPLDPAATTAHPQVSPAIVYRGGDPANERVTVFWQEYTSAANTDDIRMQTWSKNAVLNYDALSLIEDDDTVSLTNLYIEQFYDAPSQLDVAMSFPADAGLLICGGNTANNGTLQFSASGANSLDAINNIIGCCTYKPAANYNGAFNIRVDIKVNNGTPATTFIPVTVASVNDIPVVTVNSTNIRQGKYTFLDNISVYDPDNTTSEVTLKFSNEAGGSVRSFDQTTQTVGTNSLLQITAAEAENKADVFLQDGTTTAPIAQLQACDGLGCSPVTNLLMNFQPDNMPQIDKNEVPITEGKTTIITKKMLTSSDPDLQDGEDVRRYTFFNQVNGKVQVKKNGVWTDNYTFLEADVGTDEENSNVQIAASGKAPYSAGLTVTDGVLTTQQFPLGVKFTPAKASQSSMFDFNNATDIIKFVSLVLGIIGSGWGSYRYLHNDYVKDEDNTFANRIMKKLNIDVDFTKFSTFIDNLAGSTILDNGSNSVKNKVGDLVDHHHHWSPFGCWVKKKHQLAENEINQLAQIFADQLTPYIRANEKKTRTDAALEEGDNKDAAEKESAKKENSCFKQTMMITSIVLGKPFNLRRAENELVTIKSKIENAINTKNKNSPTRLKRMQTFLGGFIPSTSSAFSVEMSNTSLGNNSSDKLQL